MASVRPEELIEVVRKHPVLYDKSKEQYRNTDFKLLVWKEVARELNAEGQQEECKKKWASIRDSFRRARQKRKTKSGQAATSISKYKYESILEFLTPHIAERKGLSNFPDEAVDEDEDTCEPGNVSEPPNHDTQQPDVGNTDKHQVIPESSQSTSATAPPIRDSAAHRSSYAGRKRKFENSGIKSSDSPSAQLMAYILAEKQAEKANSQQSTPPCPELHHVDAFLAGIAISLKALDPIRQNAAKGKIFSAVQELELEQLQANSELRT